MSTESVVNVIQDAVVIRLQSTEEGFFSRLEEEFYAAFFDVADELGGCGKNHSGVRVMAAGVDAGIFSVDNKRKGVHIGAEHDCGSGFCTVNVGNNTGSADAADRFKPHFLQFGSDVVTGLVFVEAEFRDLVKIGSHG